MNELLASLCALALCFAGMAALSLAMDRHYEQLTGAAEPPHGQRLGLRLAGTVLLAAALWPCVRQWGWGVGLAAWCAWLTAGAMAVAWTLPYRPRGTVRASAASGAVGVLSLLALILFPTLRSTFA